MTETATIYVLKQPKADDDLDGYAFADAEHARTWCQQSLVRPGHSVVKVEATSSGRRCGCCGSVHWWMVWRGKRVRVGGAWKPPREVDDGEE